MTKTILGQLLALALVSAVLSRSAKAAGAFPAGFRKGARILFQGDSITDGGRGPSADPNHWIWGGVHPTYAGHQLMADEWERVVRAFWRR